MAIPGLFGCNQVGRAQVVSFRFGEGVKPVRRKKKHRLEAQTSRGFKFWSLCWILLFIKDE